METTTTTTTTATVRHDHFAAPADPRWDANLGRWVNRVPVDRSRCQHPDCA